jgi:hypothetical protein
MMRVLGVLSLLVALLAVGAACGHDEDAYSGYWDLSSMALPLHDLLEVRTAGDAYEVRFDTLPWRRAEVVDDRLRLQPYGRDGAMVTFGVGLEVSDAKATVLVSASPSPISSTVTRLSEAEYRARLDAMADRELPLTVRGLAEFVREWAEAHEGVPPAPSEMTAGSDFGDYVDERIGSFAGEGLYWPWNPFTGEPIAIGTDPGELSYAVDGPEFTLAVHDSSGALVSP